MTDSLRNRLQAALTGYTIERELGGGGMSRLFLATEEALQRQVAIKVLGNPGASLDAERFRREILLSARLQHPNIVPVLRAGEVEGLAYFIMPYVSGDSLRTILRRDGRLSIPEAIRLLRNVASALATAHDLGIVHRDIKPDNVMVSGGVGVVLDFGVSKALADSFLPSDGDVTMSGHIVGTPAYMAPEQVAGDATVDARADVYAFGILAFELLTGRSPFGHHEVAGQFRAHLIEVPPSILAARQDVPPELAHLVDRCLEKDRHHRPESAVELLRILDATFSSGSFPAPVVAGTRDRATATVVALAPAIVYGAVCVASFIGLRWLVLQGELSFRVAVLAAIGALLGLPLVLAAGLVLQVWRRERQPQRGRMAH